MEELSPWLLAGVALIEIAAVEAAEKGVGVF